MRKKPKHKITWTRAIIFNQSCLFNFLSFEKESENDLSSNVFVLAFSDVTLVVSSGLLVTVVVSSSFSFDIKHEFGNFGISYSSRPSISLAQKEKNSLQKQSVLKFNKTKSEFKKRIKNEMR